MEQAEAQNHPETEKREFRLHKDILFSVIQKQAGTIGKALLELVMNSVDAGASRVDITLSETGFSVKDDGKGFTSRTEIEEFFETFGTPHTQGDATYGRFRMGRGQIMAFTRNRWHSGPFRMNVDIRDLGLMYELTEDGTLFNGCAIEGEFYKELKPSEYLSVKREMTSLVKYTPIPVYLNGEQISLDVDSEKWTDQDENAYYKIQNKPVLSVYNLGIHVRDYPASSVGGAGGLLVSKKQLEVNFARNDVLASDCPVWQAILPALRSIAAANEKKKPTKNAAYRVAQALRLMSGDYEDLEEMILAYNKEQVFTDICGRHYSIRDCRDIAAKEFHGNIVFAPSITDRVADKIHASKLALVLSPVTLDNFDHSYTFDRLLRCLKEGFDHLEQQDKTATDARAGYIPRLLKALKSQVLPFAHVANDIRTDHTILDQRQLTAEEKRVLQIIKKNNGLLLWMFDSESRPRDRTIAAGESDTMRAWTNGTTGIWINRKELCVSGYAGSTLNTFLRLGVLLLHEYCHDEKSIDSHMHDAEFYARYHDMVIKHSDALAQFARLSMERYLALREKENAPKRLGGKRNLDVEKRLRQIETA